ncbi:clusterin-like protein 1 [Gadus macrocephalus]|uniref:clusterin-like protein 1 n=1 Tax=Gadus macrocephalus TaxID=80720 RepID=UPI0028CB726E|nr:clusterin-like protein 1 [Gadus macrocephalus]
MRILLGLLVLATTLVVLHAALEEQPNALPVETLKQLSLDGEKLVDAEVKRALYGVKDIQEVMRSNELKHQHLMKSLKRSSEKKEGAAQLKQEVTEKLIQAEQKCRDSLQSEWEQCRPCLEEACKSFYTSTCRRGFASFRSKAQSFFHRVSRRSVPQEPTVEAGDIMVNQEPGSRQAEAAEAAEAALIEASFSQLMRRVGGLVERSRTLVGRSRSRLDDALRGAFFNRDESESDGGSEGEIADPASPGPFDPAHDSGFLQGVGLDEVLDSFYDFGRSVVEEFGAVVATKVLPKDFQGPEGGRTQVRGVFPRYQHNRKLCRDLRRQTSECWQLQHQCEACQGPLLKECPSVRELHVALEEASQLLEVCREQYEEVLAVVQRHTDQTLGWLGDMAAEYSWVAPEWTEEGSTTARDSPWNMFRITTVLPKSSGGEENANATETEVRVTVLNSAPLTFSVPGELQVQDPGFLQYVTQEALDRYKDMVRLEDE